MENKIDEIKVRVTPAVKRAVEQAAAAEDIPVSTWIRNQVVASLYLSGVQSAPEVIYQGFRHSIQDMADHLEEVTLAARALPKMLENLMAAAMIAGGMDPLQAATLAEELVLDALTSESQGGE